VRPQQYCQTQPQTSSRHIDGQSANQYRRKRNVSTHSAAHKAQPCVLPYWKGLRPSQTNPNSTAPKGGVSTVKEILMNGNNEEWVSKTQMKKRMDELQDLGM